MKNIYLLILITVFTGLSAIHYYWALGGTWGFSTALPTDQSGKRLLNPSSFESAFVGTGLLLFALFYLLQSDLVTNFLPLTISNIVSWFIPAIFLLRAMGDFRYIGFFKKLHQTPFAQADTFYFSPLCLLIGIIGLILIRMN